ncbi:Rcy1p [Sugiyamaella lignohabitans]|uniref:Rcy1p n=1 Tax=Sugiyamaella lignohabitans TaxID=796027 RepID=A0A161HHV8_9ASCO|nr:Rcy1p [Sugiyamaella lignohabitans]ANB11867.1 Rcy1p [Sugiyamaella lignohabitans]
MTSKTFSESRSIPMGTGSFQALVPSRVQKSTLLSGSIFDNSKIVTIIAEYLPVPDLCNLAQVSKICKNAVYAPYLWQQRLENVNVHAGTSSSTNKNSDPLTIFDGFKYNPSDTRSSCLKLYRALGVFYYDLVNNPETSHVFSHAFTDPVDQAKLLGQLKRFSTIDPIQDGYDENISRLNSTIDLFENAALSEFEKGIDESHDADIDSTKLEAVVEHIKKYANVLVTLNGGDSCVQLFIQKHPLIMDQPKIPPLDFLDDSLKLKSQEFQGYLQNICNILNRDSKTIDMIFSNTIAVMTPLFERVLEENIMETVSTIIDSLLHKSKFAFLAAVPEIYSYILVFEDQLEPGINSGDNFKKMVSTSIDDFYSLYIDNYLEKELERFTEYAESEVSKWSREIQDTEEATESFLWSNVTKEKDKTDFLTSFKKVLLMPVSVISSSSGNGNNNNNNNASSTYKSENISTTSLPGTVPPSFSSKLTSAPPSRQSMTSSPVPFRTTQTTPIPPSSELDAMVAVMNSKLESIKTLFSLELAVNIIREGKESIERMGRFVNMGGEGTHAKSQCEAIFIELIHTLGERHVKGGFSKAIQTLNLYDPKQHRKTVTGTEANGEELAAVEPLAIFAELVNIGDLIQQMVHVFFEEELGLRRYVDRNDFLSPSLKAKKKFEQMLDDCVANGLSRGIDVLIDQIDFLFVTVQLGSDYNPIVGLPQNNGFGGGMFGGLGMSGDLGPTTAAQKVVTLLSSHMTLLVGSTEKSVLDVFQQEVGLRFFGSVCKHIKRQVISTDGAINLISDLNYYYSFILGLKQKELVPYFAALKEVGQLFLIDGGDSKALGATLSDMVRFRGVFKPEELLEFVECRKDWTLVRRDVEKVMYGFGIDCVMM